MYNGMQKDCVSDASFHQYWSVCPKVEYRNCNLQNAIMYFFGKKLCLLENMQRMRTTAFWSIVVCFKGLLSVGGLSRSFCSVVISFEHASCKCQVSTSVSAGCQRESLFRPSTVRDHYIILLAFRIGGKHLISVMVQKEWAEIILVVWDKLQEWREGWIVSNRNLKQRYCIPSSTLSYAVVKQNT